MKRKPKIYYNANNELLYETDINKVIVCMTLEKCLIELIRVFKESFLEKAE